MPRLTMTIGLPGSGKTTWLRKYIADKPNTIIICRDDLRQSLAGGEYVFYSSREPMIKEMSRQMMLTAFRNGFDVAMDETMIRLSDRQSIIQMAKDLDKDIICSAVYFAATAPTCISRREKDTKGSSCDWHAIISQMYQDFDFPDATEFDEFEVI